MASLLTVDAAFVPWPYLNLVVGYGAGVYGLGENYSVLSVPIEREQTYSGGVLVTGIDVFPYHNGKRGVGLSGRYFNMSSGQYTYTSKSQGVTTSYNVERTVRTEGWFITGVIQFLF